MRACGWSKSRHVLYTKPNYSPTGQYFYSFKQYCPLKWTRPRAIFSHIEQYCPMWPCP